MLKGFFLYYLLSLFTGNPILAVFLLLLIYAVVDKAYFRLLPDFSAPFRRQSRIKALLAELAVNPANAPGAQELGTLYFEKGSYRQAAVYLEKAQERIKNSARLYLYLGMAYMELDRRLESQQALLKAIELDPKVGRGLAYIYLLRFEMEQPEPDLSLMVNFKKKFADFANTENFFRMGMVYKTHGDKKKALEMFEGALRDYQYVPPSLRKLHRRWALLAWFRKMVTR